MTKGMITDIKRGSIHDGPGIRTTVFLKGCPLRCAWCHNPECISFGKEILYYPDNCIGCGKCDEGCYSGAKVECGKEMTVAEVMEQIREDIHYYNNGGGVTVSGGEPLAQPEFCENLIHTLKKDNIHTAIETSLYMYNENILNQLDLLMADFKIWDDMTHREYTGVSNRSVKDNLLKADSLNIPIIVRTPVIPGIEQGIEHISGFVKELKNVIQYELLPYHPLGITKQLALGKEPVEFNIPTKEYMKELSKYAYIR